MNELNTSPSDRRAHRRYPFRVSGAMKLPGGRVVTFRTLDLGSGGAGVVCDVNVQVGTQIVLRMMLPARPAGSSPFEASALVANCTFSANDGGFRIGLDFGELEPQAASALRGALP